MRWSCSCNFFVHVFLLGSIVERFNRAPEQEGVLRNKTPLILFVLLFLVFALWAQKDQPPAKTPTPESKVPPEEAAKVNPVKPTA